MPPGSESGVFAVGGGEFSGFQFGRPANPSGELSVRLFSDSSSLNFIFVQKAGGSAVISQPRSEEHTSELQSLTNLVCRLLLEKKKKTQTRRTNKTITINQID